MVSPQVVHKQPITAARFEGGEKSANEIIAWAISNGDTAVHRPREDHGDYGRGEVVVIMSQTSGRLDVAVGAWVVFEYGGYYLHTADSFFRIFQGDQLESPQKALWEQVLKTADEGVISTEGAYVATNVWGVRKYELIPSEVEAIQFPTQQSFEAAKDYEERIRKVAAFIVNNGGEVTDQGKDFLGIDLNRAGEDTLRDKQWIVKDRFGDLKHLSNEDFRNRYKVAS